MKLFILMLLLLLSTSAMSATDTETWIAANKADNVLETKIAIGRVARKKCELALDLIAGYNLSGGKTSAEIDAMIAEFSAVHTALKNYRPNTAKTLIEAISNVLYTSLKTDLLEVLK